ATGRELPSRMEVSGNGQPSGQTARILVNLEGAKYPIVIDPLLVQHKELTASDGASNDYFGGAVSLSGNGQTALIGSYGKIFTDSNNISHTNQGAAYVFTQTTNGSWSQQKILTATDGTGGDYFGNAVSLNYSGTIALIGAFGKAVTDTNTNLTRTNQGAAYIFTGGGNSWSQQISLTASDGITKDWFGVAVSLNYTGTIALIGAYGKTITDSNSVPHTYQGAAYVFVGEGNSWSQQITLTENDGTTNDYFGFAVSLDMTGTTALIGAAGKTITDTTIPHTQGAAYLYSLTLTPTNNISSPVVTLTAPNGADGDLFGRSVSLSQDGQTALIGAPSKAVTTTNQGAAYIFTPTNGIWLPSPAFTLTARDVVTNTDRFGWAVSLNSNGTIALVGAYGKQIGVGLQPGKQVGVAPQQGGAYYIFVPTSINGWSLLTATTGAAYDLFGYAVSLSGDGLAALVGSYNKTIGTNTRQGAAYVFGVPLTTTTTLTITPTAQAEFGKFVTMTASITPPDATGMVRFSDDIGNGSIFLDDSPIISGVATYLTSTIELVEGNHSITAEYIGEGKYLGSTSVAVPYTVLPGTIISLTVNPPER
ncbi:MAG: Ig-like domain repeat protein, partial [Chloroflexota bacterium]